VLVVLTLSWHDALNTAWLRFAEKVALKGNPSLTKPTDEV